MLGNTEVKTSDISRWYKAGLGIVSVFVLIIAAVGAFEWNDASTVMVLQHLNGGLTVETTQGVKFQGWGTITKYPKRKELRFELPKRTKMVQGGQYFWQLEGEDSSLPIRFNDKGKATIGGTVSWEMPLARADVLRIFEKFPTVEAVESQLVHKALESAAYFTGPLMSSTESAGERRPDLVHFINDQALHGVYETHTETVKETDSFGNKVEVTVVKVTLDKQGHPARNQSSLLAAFNVTLLPLAINEVRYSDEVEEQISQQQRAIMGVKNAQYNAKKSEQDAISAQKKGEADAATAKWQQEVIKAREVTQAEQRLAVAVLAAKEADAYKQSEILKGQGEAERKRLVMQADGALEKKLAAWVEINKQYAEAIANYQGSWTPTTVMGGTGQSGVSGASELIHLLTAKTAMDLGLDPSMRKGSAVEPKAPKKK